MFMAVMFSVLFSCTERIRSVELFLANIYAIVNLEFVLFAVDDD